jgi:hypothetical protein
MLQRAKAGALAGSGLGLFRALSVVVRVAVAAVCDVYGLTEGREVAVVAALAVVPGRGYATVLTVCGS